MSSLAFEKYASLFIASFYLMTTLVSGSVPDLEVLCGRYSVFCASSCQTYQQQCAETFGEIGIINNNIPYPVIIGKPPQPASAESNLHENILHLHLTPPAEKKICKGKNAACSTNKDCCLEYFCKHHKTADGHLAKIGTCQIPYYLDKIVPRTI